MTENTKSKGKAKKKRISKANIIAYSVLGLIVLIFIFAQIFITSSSLHLTTEVALADTAIKTVDVDMFIVRDEKIISASGGNIASAVNDGERVGVGDTVAYSFTDSTSAGNIVRMREIEKLLDYYESLRAKSSAGSSDTQQYDNEIMENVYSLADTIASGSFAKIPKIKDGIRDSITSKQTAMGVELNLTSIMQSLHSEYNTLRQSTGRYSEIKADSTGYYISGTDGYENTLNYSDAKNWTIDQVEKAINSTPAAISQSNIGRVVHGYYWYLACVTETTKINSLRENGRVTISFKNSAIDDIKAQVYTIKADKQTGKSLVVFRCLTMNEELSSLRCESGKIHIETYEGYRVNSQAIRVNENNETGVYVIKGAVMRFKKVKIVYTGDEYCIVTNPYKDDVTMKNQYINLYDEYITNGKGLEDGKIIQ